MTDDETARLITAAIGEHSGVISGPLLTIALTAVVAAAGYFLKIGEMYVREQRRQIHHRKLIRIELLSELNSMISFANGEKKFANQNSNPQFTWVPIFLSHLPSASNTAMVSELSSAEVGALIHYFRTYQEHIGYIIRNSARAPELISSDFWTPSGYDLSNAEFKEYYIWSIDIISKAAKAAVKEIHALLPSTLSLPMSSTEQASGKEEANSAS